MKKKQGGRDSDQIAPMGHELNRALTGGQVSAGPNPNDMSSLSSGMQNLKGKAGANILISGKSGSSGGGSGSATAGGPRR